MSYAGISNDDVSPIYRECATVSSSLVYFVAHMPAITSCGTDSSDLL